MILSLFGLFFLIVAVVVIKAVYRGSLIARAGINLLIMSLVWAMLFMFIFQPEKDQQLPDNVINAYLAIVALSVIGAEVVFQRVTHGFLYKLVTRDRA